MLKYSDFKRLRSGKRHLKCYNFDCSKNSKIDLGNRCTVAENRTQTARNRVNILAEIPNPRTRNGEAPFPIINHSTLAYMCVAIQGQGAPRYKVLPPLSAVNRGAGAGGGGQLPPQLFVSRGWICPCPPPKFWQSLGISTFCPPPPTQEKNRSRAPGRKYLLAPMLNILYCRRKKAST